MTRWPIVAGISAFDRSVGIAIGGLLLILAFSMIRGDQVGVLITRATPEGRTGRGAVVAIQFGEAMKRDTVAERLTFEPALAGAISWSGSRLIYRPNGPLADGAQYAVTRLRRMTARLRPTYSTG